MRLKLVATIYRKEMTDLLRDRRTLLSMVLLPLVAIPAIILGAGKFMAMSEKKSSEEATSIGITAPVQSPELAAALERSGLKTMVVPDLRAAIESRKVSAGVEEAAGIYRLLADRTRQASGIASDRLQASLNEVKEQKVLATLAARGLPAEALQPFHVTRVNVANERKMGGFIFGTIVGYVVVLLMFSGGMYPTIDMTAGEKERRTLEALLATPSTRTEIVLGKMSAAATATYTTALMTMASLVFALKNGGLPGSAKIMSGGIPLDGFSMALVLLALLPLAVMASSLMMAIAVTARGFKEAQSYLTPLVMMVIFPALLGGLPGMDTNPLSSLIPVFNTSQLIKSILQGDVKVAAFALTFGANLVFASLAFAFSVRTFNRESVLFRT
ncbi:MAG: ABC transporter permease [Acidobacteria bacterium]|nr:ABC transporter permease [Acidobacteriota bacterium]